MQRRRWIRIGEASGKRAGTAEVSRSYVTRDESDGRRTFFDIHDDEPPVAALPATAHVLRDGTGEVALVARLRRLESLSHEEFLRHWREEHAHFGLAIPGARRYEQFHVDAGHEYDGVMIVEFDAMGDLQDGLRSDLVAVDARADEENFIDHARSFGDVCRVERDD